GGDVHGAHQHHGFADAAFLEGGFHPIGDVDDLLLLAGVVGQVGGMETHARASFARICSRAPRHSASRRRILSGGLGLGSCAGAREIRRVQCLMAAFLFLRATGMPWAIAKAGNSETVSSEGPLPPAGGLGGQGWAPKYDQDKGGWRR